MTTTFGAVPGRGSAAPEAAVDAGPVRAAAAGDATRGPGARKTAAQRRADVLDAATVEFAAGGLAGTSTDAIARRAGISQPYLFRLYPTKKALFLAMVERCFDQTERLFAGAAEGLAGEPALHAMGAAYQQQLADRTALLAQMQTYAACSDHDICAVARRRYGALWETVERISGCSGAQVRDFFAMGMLLNVAAAMDLPSLGEKWARVCSDPEIA